MGAHNIKFSLPVAWAIEVTEDENKVMHLKLFSPYNEVIKFKSRRDSVNGECLDYLKRELGKTKE